VGTVLDPGRLPWVPTLAVLAGALACGPPPRPPIDDDGWGPQHGLGLEPPPPPPPPAPRVKPIPAEQRKRWSNADQIAGLHPVAGRGPSEHDTGFERTVLRNEAAAAYERLAGRPVLPVGALIVQRHHRPGSNAAVSYYVMHKRAPSASPTELGWQFLVLDDQLRVATHEPLELCVRCHQEAPVDGLFGPPTLPDEEPDGGAPAP
jgi:hypothetical protein